jgi:hypothetical protein
MAQLATQFVSRAIPLTTKAFAAATAGGDSFTTGDEVYLEVKNASGSQVTCTVATPGTVEGIAESGFVFTVAATTGLTEVGPFPSRLFGTTATITYSAVTSLTIACKSMGQ